MEQAKAKKNNNETINVAPTFLSKSVCQSFGKSNNFPSRTSPMCWFVSGRYRAVKTTAIIVMIPAIINGTPDPKPKVSAEIAGPKTNPKLKADPISPKARALSCGFVESEITANATGILPAVNPSSARAINKNSAFGANAMVKNDAAVPKIEISKRGRLPYLSDSRPIIGVAKNWQIENIANKSPFWKSESPYFLEYAYKMGITIPYPSMFTKAMRAIIKRFLFSFNMKYYYNKN